MYEEVDSVAVWIRLVDHSETSCKLPTLRDFFLGCKPSLYAYSPLSDRMYVFEAHFKDR